MFVLIYLFRNVIGEESLNRDLLRVLNNRSNILVYMFDVFLHVMCFPYTVAYLIYIVTIHRDIYVVIVDYNSK